MPQITKKWTDTDIEQLRKLASEGATAARAAAALNRNTAAVTKMARVLGVPLVGTRQAKAAIKRLEEDNPSRW